MSNRICAGKLGFSFGLIWGLGLMMVAWAGMLWGYGLLFINTIASIYPGYAPTFKGALIGGAIGFVDFFIFFFLAGTVYNWMSSCRCKSCTTCACCCEKK